MEIHICNLLYKQTQRKKSHAHLLRCRKSIWQNTTTLHVKSIGEIMNSRALPKHNNSNLLQTNSPYQIKSRHTWSNPTKIWDKTRKPTLPITIQHCTWSPRQSNSTTKGDQGDTNWKRRSQNITFCRWYDSIYKWP